MTPEEVLALLRLPAAAVLGRRVAKSDLADRLAKPADRRLVNDRVEALHWHAAINPANTGLPAGGTPGLAVVTLATRGDNLQPPPRLLALVHRVVPDPILLLTSHGAHAPVATTLSARPAIGDVFQCELPPPPAPLPAEVASLLAVDRAGSLSDLHRRWAEAIVGITAWSVIGRFPAVDADPEARRAALAQILELDAEIHNLTAAARREKQAGRRAELNQRLQQARRQREEAAEAL